MQKFKYLIMKTLSIIAFLVFLFFVLVCIYFASDMNNDILVTGIFCFITSIFLVINTGFRILSCKFNPNNINSNNLTNSDNMSKGTKKIIIQNSLILILFLVVTLSINAFNLKKSETSMDNKEIDSSSLGKEIKDEKDTKDELNVLNSKNNNDNSDNEKIKPEIINVNIEQEMKIDSEGYVYFIINTNLPDETELMLTLYRDSPFYRGGTHVTVKNGTATSGIFSYEDTPLSGDFKLDISMSLPTLQSNNVRAVVGEKGEYITGDCVIENDIGKFISKTFDINIANKNNEQQEPEPNVLLKHMQERPLMSDDGKVRIGQYVRILYPIETLEDAILIDFYYNFIIPNIDNYEYFLIDSSDGSGIMYTKNENHMYYGQIERNNISNRYTLKKTLNIINISEDNVEWE